jgi:hypothetical protein
MQAESNPSSSVSTRQNPRRLPCGGRSTMRAAETPRCAFRGAGLPGADLQQARPVAEQLVARAIDTAKNLQPGSMSVAKRSTGIPSRRW